METTTLYWFLILPSIKQMLLTLGGLGLVGFIVAGGFTCFIGAMEESERISKIGLGFLKHSAWFVVPIIMAAFIPTEKMMYGLLGWELASNIDGIQHLPEELIKTLQKAFSTAQDSMDKFVDYLNAE